MTTPEVQQDEQRLTNSHAAQKELADLKFALDQHAIVAITDVQGTIGYVNDKFCAISQYSKEELIRQNHRILNSSHHPKEFFQQMYYVISNGKVWHGEIKNRAKDGSTYWVDTTIVPFMSVEGKPRQYVAIRTDITDRKRAEEELARAKEAAELANRTKSEFLANMSHEIRTPMNAVVGMMSLLLDMPLEAEVRDFVETIRTSSDALLAIINDVLDFSKIESGKLELEDQPFDLTRCVEEAADLFRSRVAEKSLELMIEMDQAAAPWISGDATRLRQILVNLIGNAVKFTETGDILVAVRLDSDNNELHFAVRDTGPGISGEGMQRLFHSFSQVDASTTRKHGGTGLGLAISKRLAELMGGRIWVESEPGKGSVFQFAIPQRSAPAQQSFDLKREKWAGTRVLIVDDNADNRRILDHQLRDWSLDPVVAASPSAALQILERDRFPLALLDFDMPGMDGLRLARTIAELKLNPSMKMAILSSCAASLNQLLQDGGPNPVDAFLSKPVKAHILAEAIGNLLAGTASASRGHRSGAIDHDLAKRHPLSILLAEDNVVNQKVAVRLLKRMGYRPDIAGNGLEVLSPLKRQHYDIVLLDVQMPEMNGLEVAGIVTGPGWDYDRPHLIALTANAMHEDREECLAAGMADFVPKPLDIVLLQQALLRFPAASAHQPAPVSAAH
jgi:two-component system sensor histidine kinase/response regulator